jgi:thymidylate synthase (FAD)
LRVAPIASTVIRPEGWELFEELGFDPYNDPDATPFEVSTSDGDILAEFSGRNCYQSFNKPNPETASNKNYVGKNLIGKSHESVFEHSVISFYVSGVSRNLLLELERHRHISFSVISTRYVSPDKMGVVIHPNTPVDVVTEILQHDSKTRKLADKIYLRTRAQSLGVKEAREVARQVLPGNTETKFVVTGNVRAWRYVINLRNHPTADAEIQKFAAEILRHLKNIVPNSVQDM